MHNCSPYKLGHVLIYLLDWFDKISDYVVYLYRHTSTIILISLSNQPDIISTNSNPHNQIVNVFYSIMWQSSILKTFDSQHNLLYYVILLLLVVFYFYITYDLHSDVDKIKKYLNKYFARVLRMFLISLI